MQDGAGGSVKTSPEAGPAAEQPHTLPSPPPTSLGPDCNQEGRPGPVPKPLPGSGLLTAACLLPDSTSPIPALERGPEPHALLLHTGTKLVVVRPFLWALPLQSGGQQGAAGLALLSSHCVLSSGMGTQQETRMGKGLSREPLEGRKSLPASIHSLLADASQGFNNPRCGTGASSSEMPPWLDARLGAGLWTVSQDCYFRALRTASSFMATARSPFTFSRPLM